MTCSLIGRPIREYTFIANKIANIVLAIDYHLPEHANWNTTLPIFHLGNNSLGTGPGVTIYPILKEKLV